MRRFNSPAPGRPHSDTASGNYDASHGLSLGHRGVRREEEDRLKAELRTRLRRDFERDFDGRNFFCDADAEFHCKGRTVCVKIAASCRS